MVAPANTPTPSWAASVLAPCLVMVRGPKRRSTSSSVGPKAAKRADPFQVEPVDGRCEVERTR